MKTNRTLRLLTENLPEQRALEAIFSPERERGQIRLSSLLTASAAASAAELSLLEHPEAPVALVLNAQSKDPETIEERKQSEVRFLSRTTPTGWLLTLAVPDVDSWVMADSRIRHIFEADEATRDNRFERAARIGQLALEQPLNREEIGGKHPEFQELVAFIEQHTRVPLPTG